MKVPHGSVIANTGPKVEFKGFLSELEKLAKAEQEMVVVTAMEGIPRYAAEAAKDAVTKRTREVSDSALRKLISVIQEGNWNFADVFADLIVRMMTLSKSDFNTSHRLQGSVEELLPFRYFLHTTVDNGVSPSVAFSKIVSGFAGEFGKFAALDDFGWLQGSIRASSMGLEGSPDGLFLVVRVKDSDTLSAVKEWLGALECNNISTPQMVDVDLPSFEEVEE